MEESFNYSEYERFLKIEEKTYLEMEKELFNNDKKNEERKA